MDLKSQIAAMRNDVKERSKAICDTKIEEIFNNWEDTGIDGELLNLYSEQIIEHLSSLMIDMVTESFQKKQEILQTVKTLAKTTLKLNKELGTSFSQENYDELPLLSVEKLLKEQVQNLQQLKDQRIKYKQDLLSKEMEICKRLGLKPTGFNSEIPTDQEVKNFKSYLAAQEAEEKRLIEVFMDARKSIMKMMEDLQIKPSLDFEKMICNDYSNFVYSSNNMSKLKDLKERLKEQVEQTQSLIQEKKETLLSLWDCLDEPDEIRNEFLYNHPGFGFATLNAFELEIKRCLEKRRENISAYIIKLRTEISKLWDLCKVSDSKKKSFAAYYCNTFNDDLLTLHEMQAEKLRKFYNANRKIYELLNEWELQFEKLKDLDKRANDPDRYHNRGGQLLMEEKERKAAEKKLPKLETQLYNLINEYEKKNKKVFSIYGMSLSDFMSYAREQYEIEKENIKLARKQAKDKSAKKTPLSTSKRTPGTTSMLRGTPGTNSRLRLTPASTNISRATPAAKRKLPYDPSPHSVSKKRAVGNEKTKTTFLASKIRRSGRLSGKNLNASNKSQKSQNGSKKKRKSNNETTLSITSYGNFQEHLDDRAELRSSILPEDVLKKAGKKMITPIKTPVKPVRRNVLANSTPNNMNTRSARGTPKSTRAALTPRLVAVQNSSIEI